MRQHIDPKHFYKKDSKRARYPDFFQVGALASAASRRRRVAAVCAQIGTVVAGAADFYSGRLARRERAPNLVQSVLDDSERRGYLRRRFLDVQARKQNVSFLGRRSGKQRKRRRAGSADG